MKDAGIRGGVGGQLDGRQGEDEGEQVEKDVSRVGKERQGISPDTTDHLGHQSQSGQDDGILEPAGDAFVEMEFGVHGSPAI